jgi:hypothetical protein
VITTTPTEVSITKPVKRPSTTTATRPTSSSAPSTSARFTFDRVFGEESDNGQVFEVCGLRVVQESVRGYNACCFAYGQTGSGKSWTMTGSERDPGLVPRVCQGIFEATRGMEMELEASYLEIYNERMADLLAPDRTPEPLRLRESKSVGVFVEGLSREAARSAEDLLRLIRDGDRARIVAATKMNEHSSRSHAIVTLRLTVVEGGTRRTSQMHLIDLAGSERQLATEATGQRLKEASAINKSLMMLGKVINALATRTDASHVPYRESILTRYLQDSLGGNAKTVMLTAVSPADQSHDETLSSLRYADRAKNIVNRARVNEDADKRLVRELKEEIARLQAQLASGPPGTRGGQLRAELLNVERDVMGLEMPWSEKVAQTEAEKAQRAAFWSDQGLDEDAGSGSLKLLPRLVNLNEDPMMSEKLVYLIRPGPTLVGRKINLGLSMSLRKDGGDGDDGEDLLRFAQRIPLQGPSVAERHCIIESRADGSVTLAAEPNAHTFVNGVLVDPAAPPVTLVSGNRIVVGNHHIFRYLDPRVEDGGGGGDDRAAVVDWEFAARELAAALGDMAALKDESDRKLDRKTQEAEELAEALAREKLEGERRAKRQLEELDARTEELRQERARREAAAEDATKLAEVRREFEAKEREQAELRARVDREHAKKADALEQAATRNREIATQIAGMVKTREAIVAGLQSSMMRVLQGVREANCVIESLGLDLRFDVLAQALFDLENDCKHPFVTVLLSRTNGGKGSILLEEEELNARFEVIRELYDGGTPQQGADDPFEVIDDREFVGLATVTFAEGDGPEARQAVPIVDPISREVHGQLIVSVRADPPLAEARGRPCRLTVEIVEARDLKPVSDPRCIFRVLGPDLHEGTESSGLHDNPRFDFSLDVDVPKLTSAAIKYLQFSGVPIELWGVPVMPRFSKRAPKVAAKAAVVEREAVAGVDVEAVRAKEREVEARVRELDGRVKELERREREVERREREVERKERELQEEKKVDGLKSLTTTTAGSSQKCAIQ